MPSGPPRCHDHSGIAPLLTGLHRRDGIVLFPARPPRDARGAHRCQSRIKRGGRSWYEPNCIEPPRTLSTQRTTKCWSLCPLCPLCPIALAVVVARPARDARITHRCPPRIKKRQATACTEPADARRNRRIELGTAWNRSAGSASSVLSVHSVVVSVPAPARHQKRKGTIPPHRRQPGGALGSPDAHGAIRWMLEQYHRR